MHLNYCVYLVVVDLSNFFPQYLSCVNVVRGFILQKDLYISIEFRV